MMTETRNPDTMDLDEMSALEIVTAMNREDRKVPAGIEPALPQIAATVFTKTFAAATARTVSTPTWPPSSANGSTLRTPCAYIPPAPPARPRNCGWRNAA